MTRLKLDDMNKATPCEYAAWILSVAAILFVLQFRLLPALTFSADEAQTLVSMLAPMIRDFLANG